jgi:DNA-binding LytR/AlgR family response regulator
MELSRIKGSLEKYVSLHQKEADIAVYAYPDGDSLLGGIKRLGRFELMILDILMPGMNGMELARELRDCGDLGKIIFLTSSPEYAVDSYKVGAFYYLLKPFHQEELFSLISKALLAIGDERGSSIMLKQGAKITKVELRALIYVESANHNVLFHVSFDVISSFGSLNDYENTLMADGRFVRCTSRFL